MTLGVTLSAGLAAHATEYQWTGAKSNDWSDPANWTSKSLATTTSSLLDGSLLNQTLSATTSLLSEPLLSVPSTTDSVVIGTGSAIQMPSDVTIANLTIGAGSTLSGTGNITVSSSLNLNGGSLTGAGAAIVAPNGVCNISGGLTSASASRLQKKIANYGTLNFKSGQFLVEADIENGAGGVLNIQSASLAAGDTTVRPRFVNKGLLVKSTGDRATLEMAVDNDGDIRLAGGSLNIAGGLVQRSGSIALNGGQLICPPVLDLKGGVLQGSGVITGSVLNDGAIVKPGYSPGIITINGNYTQTSTGVLQMEIGGTIPGTEHDQLIVNGDANCQGTLDMLQYNNYVPAVDTWYELLQSYGMYSDFPVKTGMYPGTGRYYDSGILGASYVASVYADTTLPTASLTAPANNTTYTSLTTATGTASDAASGLGSVTAYLYRYATDGKAAGYWTGGTSWVTTYNAATCERPVTGTSSWSLTLPTLPYGMYAIRSTTTDNASNIRRVTNTFWKSNGSSTVVLSGASAKVATNTVVLPFSANLDAVTAADATRYAVTVNGVAVSVTGAVYTSATRTVTLSLPGGTLQAGETVVATWNKLFDSTGKIMNASSPSLSAI